MIGGALIVTVAVRVIGVPSLLITAALTMGAPLAAVWLTWAPNVMITISLAVTVPVQVITPL